MDSIKSILILTLFILFGCNSNKRKIIETWISGVPKIERVYSDTPGNFIEKHYYENGQLASSTRFTNSVKNGDNVAFYRDGKLLGKSIYKNGKINGEVTEFHPSGRLMFKGNQVDGNLIGNATHYYANGKPETELYYKANKVFLVNYWDSSGKQQIKNGSGVREYQSYLDKNQNDRDTTIDVLIVGKYKDSLKSGLWKYYRLEDHKLVLEVEFRDGKIFSEQWK